MDEAIKGNFPEDDYIMVKDGINSEQLLKVNEIITNKNYHLTTDLGTCEISGAIVLKDRVIYLTCGEFQN